MKNVFFQNQHHHEVSLYFQIQMIPGGRSSTKGILRTFTDKYGRAISWFQLDFGLNVSPKVHMLENPQYNSVGRWGLISGQSPHEWINVNIRGMGQLLQEWAYYKSKFSPLLLSCPSDFHHGMMQHEGPHQMQTLNLGLPSLQNCEKYFFIYKVPSL